MEVRCFLYSCILLLGLGGEVVSAQTFRRIKNVRELEDGAHYVLAGYCAAHPDSLYVMASQDKTGTGKKNRAARKLPLDVGSAGSALPPFGGRFPPACPQTVLASLPAYGFPLVTSVYLP